tara:strand:- start:1273 stop:1977 length:705 start_codon:yes stop_codon:yes gene_type:complete
MKIGDKLLKLGYLNKKQLTEALKIQSQEKILYNKDLQLGKILLDKKFLTLDELSEGLSLAIEEAAKEEIVMAKPTEIGEGSKFTFDLKFLVTMGAILVSGVGIYFTMNSAIDELKSNNSPSRLEYDMIASEITGIKNAGNLDIITYKLEQYDETFEEIKELVNDLKPLKADLDYIKKELDNLKNVDPIEIPKVDLSGLETAIDNLSISIESMENKINDYEGRLEELENKGGGRF